MKSNGRPSKFTDETVNLIESAFKEGSTVTEACYIAQISRETYYEWCESQKDFSDRMKRAQEYPDNIAKRLIVKAMTKGDVETAKWWGKNKMREEFYEKSKSETDLKVKELPKPLLENLNVSDNNGAEEAQKAQ